ncbi:MAG: hypothetical protein KDN22_08835 [Verrucomicrobiae bacterium]|nr:hypothetical protein [Verrucomicrobiae bacterium]
MSDQNSHETTDTGTATIATTEMEARPEHPLKTGLWILGIVLVYYALQAWIFPAAGVQT